MFRLITLLFIFIASPHANATPQNAMIEGTDVISGKSMRWPGKNLVVIFVSARCPCSNSHIGELADLSKTYPQFQFVGVHSNLDEDAELTKTYFTKAALPFPVIQDEKTKIADQFKALKTPHSFVLDSNGQIVYQGGVSNSAHFSKADRKFLREALEDVKNARAIKTPMERSLGCAISRG